MSPRNSFGASCLLLLLLVACIDTASCSIIRSAQRKIHQFKCSSQLVRSFRSLVNPLKSIEKNIVGATSHSSLKRPLNYIKRVKDQSFSFWSNKKLHIPKLVLRNIIPVLVALYVLPVHASGGFTSGPAGKSAYTPVQGMCIWLFLFSFMALLHSAESAITKISPWKIQQFADEEGPKSPFATLSNNLTRLLSTIIITTTACSIYSTALFVTTVCEIFPDASLGAVTAALTLISLFFGELFPKALAVSNSEAVARKTVPLLSLLAKILLPISWLMTVLSNFVLKLVGMRSKEDTNVSEDMLRLVVDEAERSEGIQTAEGRMIKGVLDMQDIELSRIMQPRVDIIALPEDAKATEVLKAAVETRYSRIPIYRGDVDRIVGIVYSKDLLGCMKDPSAANSSSLSETAVLPTTIQTRIGSQKGLSWESLTASDLMEDAYFVPETMSAFTALQEMRKRRVHIAIVVDEYGGTAGLVTFEDILEEVVGEIYDEDDDEEQAVDSKEISKDQNSGVFTMRGSAELSDVCEAMGLDLDDETANEYSTIGGLLCSRAGEIPKAGDKLLLSGFEFTVVEVEDNRRVVELSARKVSTGEDAAGEEGSTASKSSGIDASTNTTASTNSPNDTRSFRDGEWVSSVSATDPAVSTTSGTSGTQVVAPDTSKPRDGNWV